MRETIRLCCFGRGYLQLWELQGRKKVLKRSLDVRWEFLLMIYFKSCFYSLFNFLSSIVCWEMFILPIVGVTCKVGNVYCNNFLYIKESPKSWFKSKYPQLINYLFFVYIFCKLRILFIPFGGGGRRCGDSIINFILFCFQFHFTLQWKFLF